MATVSDDGNDESYSQTVSVIGRMFHPKKCASAIVAGSTTVRAIITFSVARQVKSSTVVGLRTRVATIRTLIFSFLGAVARSEWGRPLGGTSAWRPATVS